MKTFISDIVPKIQKFSKKLDDLTLITNQQWVLINDLQDLKTTYIFRDGGILLIAENGLVSKANWEYLNTDSLLIENGTQTFLMKQSFKNEDVLVMNLDGDKSYAFFVNESKYKGSINSFEDLVRYLEVKYLKRTFLEPQNKFFYMQFYQEHGPFNSDQLISKIKRNQLNPSCLIRSTNEPNYQSGMRIRDLLEIKNM
ncbi:hypothetical protein [Salinimicrobium sediminilitoris]|uniref:hypothetical protein n=1 Tax=Salinimicrobium sediminilitoris TaxID=2876715 RepID=UPI001E376B2B|nr:hypothetical protein [Salinimicrobium sediminilitoris]MCC8360182.1 hypothetical protein [Salinimicrobium sediminilitoris]